MKDKEFKYDPKALDTTSKHYFPGTEGARKLSLPGSVSNVPTTNYARAYGIACTWASHYTVEEFKRVLIGRGIDITDIDVSALHAAGVSSGLDAVKPGESAMASKAMMQPQTPEQQEAAWAARKEEVLRRVPGVYRTLPKKPQNPIEHTVAAESLTQAIMSRNPTESQKLSIDEFFAIEAVDNSETRDMSPEQVQEWLRSNGYGPEDDVVFRFGKIVPKSEIGADTPHRKLLAHYRKAAENLLNALRIRHCDSPDKLARVEALAVSMLSDGRDITRASRDLTEAMSLADAYSVNEDPAWGVYKQELTFGTEENHIPIKYTGESEFSRIGDLDGTTNFRSGNETINRLLATGYHLDEVKLADLGVGKLLDTYGLMAPRPMSMQASIAELQGIYGIPKPAPMRGRLAHPFDHVFHNYTDEYLMEQAAKRKAKRIKNQRRRRNAKARRK